MKFRFRIPATLLAMALATAGVLGFRARRSGRNRQRGGPVSRRGCRPAQGRAHEGRSPRARCAADPGIVGRQFCQDGLWRGVRIGGRIHSARSGQSPVWQSAQVDRAHPVRADRQGDRGGSRSGGRADAKARPAHGACDRACRGRTAQHVRAHPRRGGPGRDRARVPRPARGKPAGRAVSRLGKVLRIGPAPARYTSPAPKATVGSRSRWP